MAEQTSGNGQGGLSALVHELPIDRFKDELGNAVKSWGGKAMSSAESRLEDMTGRLNDYAENGPKTKAVTEAGKATVEGKSPITGALKGGLSGLKDKAKDALGGSSGGGNKGGKGTKVTNIIENVDVGVPLRVAYNQWTEFQDFPHFMKKVEGVEQQSEEKVRFKAQVFWSHRSWEATILEQVPDERIVWRSKGEKGYVDGAITFHELAPSLTRILVVLEYHPQGLFERTGNLWRAQGRRARLELKHFRRHVMTTTILHPDEVEGWRGEIRDGEVVRSHEEVVEEEEREQQQSEEGDEGEPEDQYEGDESEDGYEDEEGDEPEDEYDDEEGDESEDEYDDEEGDEPEEEPEDEEGDEPEEEPEDEYDDEEGDEPEDEYEDDESEEEPEDEYEDEEGDEPEDEYEDEEGGEPEDEYEDEEGGEPEDEYEDEEGGEPEDEYEDEEGDEPEDEYEDDEDEGDGSSPSRSRRRPATTGSRRKG